MTAGKRTSRRYAATTMTDANNTESSPVATPHGACSNAKRDRCPQRLRWLTFAAIAGVGLLVTGCGTTRIVTTVEKQPSTGTNTGATDAASSQALTIGDSATLVGGQSGERLEVTVTEYKGSVAAGEYETPSSGMRYVAVEMRIKNVGAKPYDDSPANGAKILTATGRQAKTTLMASGECGEGFASSVKVAPGESQEGCIPFELPEGEAAAKFQWTPSSGFSEETAEWTLRGGRTSTATKHTARSTAPRGELTNCDENIAVNRVTTCPFAERVFEAFAHNIVTEGGTTVHAYSPVTNKAYAMTCEVSAGTVECVGGKEALVVFPLHAAQVY